MTPNQLRIICSIVNLFPHYLLEQVTSERYEEIKLHAISCGMDDNAATRIAIHIQQAVQLLQDQPDVFIDTHARLRGVGHDPRP